MEDVIKENSYLGGGTFFMLLVESKAYNDKDGNELPNYKLLSGLAKVFGKDCDKSFVGKTATQQAGKYRSGEAPAPGFMGFYDNKSKATFFNTDHIKLVKRMQTFISNYLYVDADNPWLVYALLEVIENDSDIPGDKVIFTDADGNVITKNIVSSVTNISFPEFLLDVFIYVLHNEDNRDKIKQAYKAWTIKQKDGTRTIDRSLFCRTRKINLIQSIVDTNDTECDDNNGDDDDYSFLERKINKTELAKPSIEEKKKFYTTSIDVKKLSGPYAKYLAGVYTKNFTKLTYLYEKELPFKEFYVCNDLNPKDSMKIDPMDPSRYIELPSIKEVTWQDFYTNKSVIIGDGGLGKSMMMNKILLSAIEDNFGKDDLIPIFVTIRSYSPEKRNLEKLLTTALQQYDPVMNDIELLKILGTGRGLILLDGFDELDDDIMQNFIEEVEILTSQYPNSQYIITSRRISDTRRLGFKPYDIQPFSQEQAFTMVEKMNEFCVPADIKAEFIEKIKTDAFNLNRDEKSSFLGNPLFLTIVLLAYQDCREIPRDRYMFYENAYQAMAKRYDRQMKGLIRPFSTKLNELTFKNYLGEFCANSYADYLFEFREYQLNEYFEQIIENNDLNITPDLFIKDMTEKLCIMYKDGQIYEFVHRSFQEYFAAVHFCKELGSDDGAIYDALHGIDYKMKKDETLNMMYAMNPKKVEQYIILPFLKQLFLEEDDDGNYSSFILKYYPEIEYVTDHLDIWIDSNYVRSAIYCFICDTYGIDMGPDSNDFYDDISYADEATEYVYIAENWKSHDECAPIDELVEKNSVPYDYYEWYDDKHAGYYCYINLVKKFSEKDSTDPCYALITDENFSLKIEFRKLQEKYHELNDYYSDKRNTKKHYGLRH